MAYQQLFVTKLSPSCDRACYRLFLYLRHRQSLILCSLGLSRKTSGEVLRRPIRTDIYKVAHLQLAALHGKNVRKRQFDRASVLRRGSQVVNPADLIQKLHNPDSKHVLQAVEELRAHGWLSQGMLAGRSLRCANLRGADLHKADLQAVDLSQAHLEWADLSLANLQDAKLVMVDLRGADLSMANLCGADLSMANLNGALNLTEQQLTQVYRLCGAILPDGTHYDGRLNLPGDTKITCTEQIERSSHPVQSPGRTSKLTTAGFEPDESHA